MHEYYERLDLNEPGIWRYRALLPTIPKESRISLGEGNTPLVRSSAIGPRLGLSSLYFKLESLNPTGSYKDRISAVGVSNALANHKAGCVGTSSGNAGASTAAYAARAGLRYQLLVLEHVAEAKVLQAALHEADIMRIRRFGESAEVGDQVFDYIEHTARQRGFEVMITAYRFNPLAMEGVKTISYELFEQLGCELPDAVFVPTGGGGLATGLSRGFDDLRLQFPASAEGVHSSASVVPVQSKGCANIVKAWEQGLSIPAAGDSDSLISGLQVPNPPDGERVLELLRRPGNWAEAVADEAAWHWQERLAAEEGILVEPAAAVSLAGVEAALRQGRLKPDQRIVCILTGAGFKDSDRLKVMMSRKNAIPLYDLSEIHEMD